jgi:hypothetical protein
LWIKVAAFPALNHWMPEHKTHIEIVGCQEYGRTDQAADDGVVIADDGVLHRVGKGQENDEVEGIELRQFAFAGEAQPNDEKKIDDDWPENFFRDRQAQHKHISPNLGVSHGSLSSQRESEARV